MFRTWLSFPMRLAICLLALCLIGYWQSHFDLGAYYYQVGHNEQFVAEEYPLALMSYQLSLNYRPQNAPTSYQMGIVLMHLGQLDAAITALENALAWGYTPRWRILNPIIRLLQAVGRNSEAAQYQAELDADARKR